MTNNPTDDQAIRFGDYVSIEEKNYVGENEWLTYKVIDVLESNSWRTVPVDAWKQEAEHHDHTELIVKVICDLPSYEKIERFRAADVRKQTTPTSEEEVARILETVTSKMMAIIGDPDIEPDQVHPRRLELCRNTHAELMQILHQYGNTRELELLDSIERLLERKIKVLNVQGIDGISDGQYVRLDNLSVAIQQKRKEIKDKGEQKGEE